MDRKNWYLFNIGMYSYKLEDELIGANLKAEQNALNTGEIYIDQYAMILQNLYMNITKTPKD